MQEMASTQELIDARRIVVLGAPGSGKTTFAQCLHEVLGLPLYHLDDHYWRAGWQRADPEMFALAQREIVAKDKWIVDGNHLPTLPIRLERADVACFIDVSTVVATAGFFGRALRRALGDRASLPRAIRLDTNYHWRPGLDVRIWQTLLFFRTSIRPEIIRLLCGARWLRAVAVLRSRRQIIALIAELGLLRERMAP
jgi:adenylate kinase family enzyme